MFDRMVESFLVFILHFCLILDLLLGRAAVGIIELHSPPNTVSNRPLLFFLV